jgi:predicted signal transduction protein with EAL and GGDEF domain
VTFSCVHETAIRQAGLIEQALRHADMDSEFSLAFQPLVDVGAGRTAGFEALARWTSPSLGAVSPGDFVPVAERSGLIARMSPVLLKWALVEAARWPDDLRLSFNLSVRDIAAPEQIERIMQIIRESGVDPERLDLEVTETAVMRDFEQAERALIALKSLGVRIALDDFGAGYSSLSYVHRLPIDKLKIDASFVRGLEEGGKRPAIVKTILDLCRNLRLDCVVEGVETAEQMLLLRSLGCRVAQGYLFARPMAAHAVAGYLAAEQAEATAVAPSPAERRAS